MTENLRVGAASFLQSIGQDGELVEGSVIVDALRQFRNRAALPGEPGGVDGDGAEGVAADLTEEVAGQPFQRMPRCRIPLYSSGREMKALQCHAACRALRF